MNRIQKLMSKIKEETVKASEQWRESPDIWAGSLYLMYGGPEAMDEQTFIKVVGRHPPQQGYDGKYFRISRKKYGKIVISLKVDNFSEMQKDNEFKEHVKEFSSEKFNNFLSFRAMMWPEGEGIQFIFPLRFNAEGR